MQQRLALVVVEDPKDRVVAPRDRWLVGDRCRIADHPAAELRVAGTPDRLTLVRRHDRLLAIDARCTVNGVVPHRGVEVRVGDVVGVGDVVVRVVEADLLDRVRKVGDWLVLENLWTSPFGAPAIGDGGPVFGPAAGGERGLAWLLTHDLDNDDVAAFSRAGGSGDAARRALPAVKDVFVDGDAVGTVFAVSPGVSLSALRQRSSSSSSSLASSAPLSLALRIGLDLNAALMALWDATGRASHLDAVVGFDGTVTLLPTARPFEGPVDDADLSSVDVDAARVAEIVCGLVPAHGPAGVELHTLLELPHRGPLSPLVVDAMLRRLAQAFGVADDAEVAGCVRGLFPDEHRRAAQLVEELALLDDFGVACLIAGSVARAQPQAPARPSSSSSRSAP